MDDMLPVWPSAYPSAMTYDFFTYAGAPGAYNLDRCWCWCVLRSDDFSISTSYLSSNGNISNPNEVASVPMALTSLPPLRLLRLRTGVLRFLPPRLPATPLYVGNANPDGVYISGSWCQTNS